MSSNGKELFEACKSNNFVEVEKLLQEKDIDINYVDDELQGQTPLIVACTYNRVEVVKRLIDHEKLDVNKKDTALSYAVIAKFGDLVRVLMQHKDISFDKKFIDDNADSEEIKYDLEYKLHNIELDKELMQVNIEGGSELENSQNLSEAELDEFLLGGADFNVEGDGDGDGDGETKSLDDDENEVYDVMDSDEKLYNNEIKEVEKTKKVPKAMKTSGNNGNKEIKKVGKKATMKKAKVVQNQVKKVAEQSSGWCCIIL